MVRSIVLPSTNNAPSAWKRPSAVSSGRRTSSIAAPQQQPSPPPPPPPEAASAPTTIDDGEAPDDELLSEGTGRGGGVSSLIQRFNHDKQQLGLTTKLGSPPSSSSSTSTKTTPVKTREPTLISPPSGAPRERKAMYYAGSKASTVPLSTSSGSPFFPKTAPPSARVATRGPSTVSSSPFLQKSSERETKPVVTVGGSGGSSSSSRHRLAQLQQHLQQQATPVTPVTKQPQPEEEAETPENTGESGSKRNKRVMNMIATFEKSPSPNGATATVSRENRVNYQQSTTSNKEDSSSSAPSVKSAGLATATTTATPTKKWPPPPPLLAAADDHPESNLDENHATVQKVDPTTPQRLGGTYLYRVGGPEFTAHRRTSTNHGVVGKNSTSQDPAVVENSESKEVDKPVLSGSGSNFSSTAVHRIDARARNFRAAEMPPTSNQTKFEASRPLLKPVAGRTMMWSKMTANSTSHSTNSHSYHKTTITPPPPPPLDFGDLSPIADNTAYGNDSTRELQLPDSLRDDDSSDVPATSSSGALVERDNDNIEVEMEERPVKSSSSFAGRSGGSKVLLTTKHASQSSTFQNRLLQFSQQVAKQEAAVYHRTRGEPLRTPSSNLQGRKNASHVARASSPEPKHAEGVPSDEPTNSSDDTDEAPAVSPALLTSSSQHKVLSTSKHASTQASSPFQRRLLQFSQQLSQQHQRDGSQQQQLVKVVHPSKGLDPNLMPHACHSVEPTEETSVATSTEDDDDIEQDQIEDDEDVPTSTDQGEEPEDEDALDLSLDDTRQPPVWAKQAPIPLAALCDLSIELPAPEKVSTEPSPEAETSSLLNGASSKVKLLKGNYELAISSVPSSAKLRSLNATAEISQEGFEVAATNVSSSTTTSVLNDAVPLDESPLVSDDEEEHKVAPEPVVLQDVPPERDTANLPPKVSTQHDHTQPQPSHRPVSLSWLARKPSHGEGPPDPPGGNTTSDSRVHVEDRNGLGEEDPCFFESYDGLSSTGQISVQHLASTLLTEEALIDSATSPRVMKEDLILLRSKDNNRGSASSTPSEQRNLLPPHRNQKRSVSGVVIPASDLTDDASLEPPVTVRKTPPRADPFLMAELDFLAPRLVQSQADPTEVQPTPVVEPSEVRTGKLAPLRPNPRDTGRSKGRTRCGPDDSQGACPVSLAVDKPAVPSKSEPPQSRIKMLASVLASSTDGVTNSQTEIAGISTASQGFPALAQEEYPHELPVSKTSTTATPNDTRSGPVDLDETVESSFEISKDQSAFDIVDNNDEDPFQVDYAGLITSSVSHASEASQTKDATANPKLPPNPKDTGRSSRTKSRSVTISTSPVAVASGSTLSPIMSDEGYSPQSSTSPPQGSSSAPETSPTITSIDSPSKANPTFEDSPSWKVTKTISQTNPMWAALDSEERVKRWRRFRRRQQHEGAESSYSYDDEYESATTSDQDSDVRSSRDKMMSLDQQWQLFNPVDVNNPLVAYYEPNSALRPRKIEKNSKRSTRPSRKSPRTLPATSGMMVEI